MSTLRERLERHAGTMRGSLAAENVAATMREAAAALERVEALRSDVRDLRDDADDEDDGDRYYDGYRCACDDVLALIAVLATPAPAGTEEGER